MKRRLFPLVLLTLATAAPGAERRYSISDFEQVRVVGSTRLVVEKGRATTVRAVGDRAALDDLLIEVTNRTLVIEPVRSRAASSGKASGKASGQSMAKAVTVYVTAPRISSARLNGSGAITLAELGGLKSDLSLSGSGQISVKQLSSDNLSLRLSGSGTLTLAGKARMVDANLKGSGSLVGAGLDSTDLKLSAASSGTISLAARRTAAITTTGSGTIVIAGTAACTVQNIGSGTVNCGKER